MPTLYDLYDRCHDIALRVDYRLIGSKVAKANGHLITISPAMHKLLSTTDTDERDYILKSIPVAEARR